MSEQHQFIACYIGEEIYALAISYVKAIEKCEAIKPLPKRKGYVSGMLMFRDSLLPVVDLEEVLYSRATSINQNVKVIVLQVEDVMLSLIVKETKEIISVPSTSIKSIPLLAAKHTPYFSRVIHHDNQLITIINPESLILSDEDLGSLKKDCKEIETSRSY